MVGTLIRMNLAMQRHSLRGIPVFWAIVGFLLALGTLALSVLANPAVAADLLAAAFAAWTLFLALAPVFGGGGGGIRPEHFALLPIPPRRLAIGLAGAATVGLAPAIALVAFAALALYGFRFGLAAGLAGMMAALLQLLLGVLLSRVVYTLMGTAMQTRLGMELAALSFALFLAAVSVGWFVIQPVAGQIGQVLAQGWPPPISTFFRILPSGWGLVATEALGRAEWGLAGLALLGLAALIGALLLVCAALMERGAAARPVSYAVRSRPPARWAVRSIGLPATPVVAVIVKELRTWMRDPWRALSLRIALWTSLLIGAIPLLIGWVDVLPFVGIIMVLMGGAVCGNLYAEDGSALWQTILTPGAERSDVRGRQLAWLLIFAPLSTLATVILTLASGRSWVWPLVLSLLFALLGGTAGLVPLFSVRFPSPGLDPAMRRNPMDSSGGTLNEIILMPWLAAVTGLPALGVVGLGFLLANPAIQWAGLPVGVGTGALFAWWLGRLAYQRLEGNGPELLNLLLRGATTRAKEADDRPSRKAWRALPVWKKTIVWLCGALFWIPLSLQGLLPLLIKLSGEGGPALEHRWFLALSLPHEFQWPMIIAMMALGAGMAIAAFQIPRKELRAMQRREARMVDANRDE